MLQDLQWDGWRKEIDVMGRIMEGIGTVIITILKWIGKIILGDKESVLILTYSHNCSESHIVRRMPHHRAANATIVV